MASTTATTSLDREEGGFRFRITRMGVIAAVFIIVGALILLDVPGRIGGDVTTLLTIDEAGTSGLAVPTVAFSVIVALSYVAGGVVALIPAPQVFRLKYWWLVVNGILLLPVVLVIIAAGGSTNVTIMIRESMRLSTPIVLGALAGLWCERSGVTNIAIEGMMLTGACFGFVTFSLLGGRMDVGLSQFIGVLIAVLAGGLMAALHAWLSLKYRTNQIVSGTVINILAIGVTSFIRRDLLLEADATRQIIAPLRLPLLADIPVVGPAIFNGRPIFYSMFAVLIITHVVMYYTRWGLRTRAVGENPHAADTLGINVLRNRWINVIIGGLIAGLAGAWFTIETTGAFDDNMTSGRGFIALAAMIFGNWTPIGCLTGGLLFGFSDALGQRFQFLGVPVPPQFLQMVPYIVTIVVLAGLIGKSAPPKADGVPWEKN